MREGFTQNSFSRASSFLLGLEKGVSNVRIFEGVGLQLFKSGLEAWRQPPKFFSHGTRQSGKQTLPKLLNHVEIFELRSGGGGGGNQQANPKKFSFEVRNGSWGFWGGNMPLRWRALNPKP